MKLSTITASFEQGGGIFRLLPAWVTMHFNQPGGRLHLHPDDWYPLGIESGAVEERWLSSVLSPRKNSTEGLSFASLSADGSIRCSLPEAIDALGAEMIGEEYQRRYGTWPVHAKFFDYFLPLFLHIHLPFEAAAKIGQQGKPEAYYFPVQLNNHPGARPATYFGLAEGVTKVEFLERLQAWEKRDTHILELSRAYRLAPGTGWYTPPGTLHAPGSLLTYEVQWNSTSGAVFENVASGEIGGMGLWSALPPEEQGNWEAVLSLLDWPVNTDPHYREHYYRPPVPIETGCPEYSQKWIVYDTPYFSAKELAVLPGQGATLRDQSAYGCVVVQGHGQIGPHACEAPGLLRFDQPSADEFFVSAKAAQAGVRIQNHSQVEPLVILKHFGPGVNESQVRLPSSSIAT